MDAKDFLKQVRKIDILVDNKQREIDRLKNKAYYPKNNSFESTMVKVIDYGKELNSMIDTLIDKKKEVQAVVDQIDNADMIDIIYKRYFLFETWEQIAEDKNYTFQWLHKLHAKALKKVQNLLKS